MQHQGPTQADQRYLVLDALRGFALLGIFLANVRFFGGWEFMSAEQRDAVSGPSYETIDFLHFALLDGKFYTLFSLLFGMGFALQLQRLEGRGAAAERIYRRRTAVLLVIGLIHLFFFWAGDILTPYALLGFVLLAVRRWSDRTVLMAAGIAYVTPVIGYCLFWVLGISPNLGLYPFSFSMMPEGVQDPLAGLLLTDWGARAQMTFAEGVLRFGYLAESWRYPKLFAIMLVGLWAGRKLMRGELLENTRLLLWVLLIGAVCGVVAGPILGHLGGLGFFRPHSVEGLAAVIAYSFAVIPLGFAYAAGFVLLWQKAPSILMVFAAPGRMALTNYLSQTLLGIAVFYGVLGGLAGHMSIQMMLLIALGFYGVQVVFSHLWLKRYQFGPMEWVWRALTYGEAPVLRLSQPA